MMTSRQIGSSLDEENFDFWKDRKRTEIKRSWILLKVPKFHEWQNCSSRLINLCVTFVGLR